MSSRVLPDVDRYATCPVHGKVLAYYAGTFESVYVVLSPFSRTVAISRQHFSRESSVDAQDNVELRSPISWETVMSLTGLPTLGAVDVGLRAMIGAISMDHHGKDFRDRVMSIMKSSGVTPPTEGIHSDLLYKTVLGMFQELGHDWVWVGDELCTERKLHWIEDLKVDPEQRIINTYRNVFSPDKTLLWTVHWDSHFSFLCSSKDNLNRLDVSRRLEGFFCDDRTEVYWSLQEG